MLGVRGMESRGAQNPRKRSLSATPTSYIRPLPALLVEISKIYAILQLRIDLLAGIRSRPRVIPVHTCNAGDHIRFTIFNPTILPTADAKFCHYAAVSQFESRPRRTIKTGCSSSPYLWQNPSPKGTSARAIARKPPRWCSDTRQGHSSRS